MSIYDVKVVYINGAIDEAIIEHENLYEDLSLGDYMVLKTISANVIVLNMQQVSRIGFVLRKN